jgi:hypothetical protein
MWVQIQRNNINRGRIWLESIGNDWSILDIGISDIDLVRYRNGNWCRYRDSFPISEWEDLVRHILFRYRNKRCRCRRSDIADIKADVHAHLCSPQTLLSHHAQHFLLQASHNISKLFSVSFLCFSFRHPFSLPILSYFFTFSFLISDLAYH